MDFKLKDKVAFVGGSSKGIGKGIALQLAREGAHLILCARNKEHLEKTSAFIRHECAVDVLALPADLSDPSQIKDVVQTAFKHFKRIDILVVNSGGPKPGTFFDLERKDWDAAYHSVLLYVIELYKHILPSMKKNNWGRIINITSLTVKEPDANLILSNVFRTGVTGLAKSLSHELFQHGITINNICPGAFETDRAAELIRMKAQAEGRTIEEIKKELTDALPRKNFSSVEDIGSLAAFLCSDAAKDITGISIPIDQGMYRGLF